MTVRITILLKKLDTISTEEFNYYWSQQHPSIFLSVPIVRQNLTRYSQFHVDAAVTAGLATHGLPVSPYDGGAEFWADSYESAMAVFQDPEYLRVVVPDEQKFLQREAAVLMVGYEEVKWENGIAAEVVKI